MFSARSETDPQLRRIARNARWTFLCALAAAAAADIATADDAGAVLGVAAGGLLVMVSYRAIRAGIDAIVAAGAAGEAPSPAVSRAWGLVKFITRFAILGAIAYVMMVRLRAQPVWMLLGASSLVAAAALEAVRAPRARP